MGEPEINRQMIHTAPGSLARQLRDQRREEDIAARVIQSGADLLYFPAQSSDKGVALLIKTVKTQNPKIQIMAGDGLANQTLEGVPAASAEGFMATDISVVAGDLDGAAAAALVTKYQAAYGAKLTSSMGTGAYEAAGLILEAIKRAKEPTRPGVLTQLRKMEYTGIYGAWRFDDNGDMSPAPVVGMQIQKGEWKFVKVFK